MRKQLATRRPDRLQAARQAAGPQRLDLVGLERNTALREFMRTPPHMQVMTSLKPYMGPTKFVTRTISAADGRPSMTGALDHLASG